MKKKFQQLSKIFPGKLFRAHGRTEIDICCNQNEGNDKGLGKAGT